jgi:hypothetical protein
MSSNILPLFEIVPAKKKSKDASTQCVTRGTQASKKQSYKAAAPPSIECEKIFHRKSGSGTSSLMV